MTQRSEPGGSAAPGPRRKRRKAARPAEIIEAALQEFAANGYAATRLEDVARRAGVAKGTIYLYFDGKQALFMAVVRSFASPTFDMLGGLVDSYPGTAGDLLRELFRILHMKFVNSEMRSIMKIMIAEGEKFPELTEFYYRENVSRALPIMKRIVDRGIASGEFRKGAVADLPQVIVAPAIMAALWKMTFEPYAPIEPERFYEAHVDLVLNGLLAGRDTS